MERDGPDEAGAQPKDARARESGKQIAGAIVGRGQAGAAQGGHHLPPLAPRGLGLAVSGDAVTQLGRVRAGIFLGPATALVRGAGDEVPVVAALHLPADEATTDGKTSSKASLAQRSTRSA